MNIAYLNNIAYIEPDTHVGEWVKKHKRLDCYPGYFERLAPYIKPGDTVIDGGAYIGDHTIAYCHMVGDQGMVIAFEPNPLPFECLCHNVPQAINVRAGLSHLSRDIFLVQEKNVASSWAASSLVFVKDIDGKGVANARAMPLDNFGLSRVDFIKLDIEGFELMALCGMERTLDQHRPILFVEVNCEALARQGATREQLLDAIVAAGYSYEPWHYGDDEWKPDPDQTTCELFDVLCKPL